MSKVRITIEFLDESERPPAVLEYDNMEIVQEQGLNFIYDVKDWGKCSDITLNGHKRACIKLYSGCQTYESFIGSYKHNIY
jgi:hypothetical protein